MKDKPIKIILVGQTPPPYGGQAIMIELLKNAESDKIRFYHVRMSFSDSFKSVGNFRINKIVHLFEVAWKVLKLRFGEKIDTLYYPPAGPNRTPIIRDIILLAMIRPFFKHIIYHFQAAGISEFLAQQPSLFRKLAMLAYGKPQVSIQLSSLNPPDGAYFGSRQIAVVPNALADAAIPYLPLERPPQKQTTILFVGVLREDKGVMVVVEAARILKTQASDFQIIFLGEFVSTAYETSVLTKVQEYGLQNHIRFPGIKTGTDKWQQYAEAHIFCFPSYFSSESFGNVVVEAMMFGLPVVSTLWRGIPDVVAEGETGFLVPVQDPEPVAAKLRLLIADPALRSGMGAKGRERYLQRFASFPDYLSAMEEAMANATLTKC